MSVMHNTHRSEVFLSKEMKKLENLNFIKKNSYSFMERAGYQVFKFISENFKKKRQSTIVLCGPGNNGGDGFVVAKYLMKKGYKIKVYTFIEKNKYTGDALKAHKKFKGIVENFDFFKIEKNTLIIDALFGIGLTRSIKGKLAKIFKLVNKSQNTVISIDIPSGVSSDTGKILGNAIKADFTITFHRRKIGHILNPGKTFSGKLKVVDIGFEKKMITRYLENNPTLWKKFFPWKRYDGHKYSRGRVVIYGSQKEFTGATILSSQAALRTGVGSVKILCTSKTLQIYSIKFPSVLKKEINNIDQLKKFLKKEKITSILIGPGSGSNKKVKEVTKLILKKVKYVVLDADSLTCFKNDLKSLYSLLDKNKIITPHLGEFHKIFPKIKKNLSNIEKVTVAKKLVRTNMILKGPSSIIVSYDNKIIINNNSSPELAVIGSGDVLSGILVSLIGEKKMTPFLAACAATWLHGDIARQHDKGLIAEDLIEGISTALKRLKNG